VKSGKFFRCKGISATALFRWDISVTAILDKNDVFGQERLKILRNWATTKISTTWKFQVYMILYDYIDGVFNSC
jgi:hypothetical protein